MKISEFVLIVVAFVAFPFSGYCAYPTMECAEELFCADLMNSTNVLMSSASYSQFADDLQCAASPEEIRTMETFLVNALTSIVVSVSTNSDVAGTGAILLNNRGRCFSAMMHTFRDFPTNAANNIAVAEYLGDVSGVHFPTNLLLNRSSSSFFFSPDPAKMQDFVERRYAHRMMYNLQLRVKETNDAVERYRCRLLSVCNVGVRGCRGIMDDAQFCTFTNQLATASNANEAERRILFDSIPSPQGEGD